jgi:hypothetical protein
MLGLFKKKRKTAKLLFEVERGMNVIRFTDDELKRFSEYMKDAGVDIDAERYFDKPQVFSLEKLSSIKCNVCGKQATTLAHYKKKSGYIGYVPYCDEHVKQFQTGEAKKDEPNISNTNAKSKSNRTNRKTIRRR